MKLANKFVVLFLPLALSACSLLPPAPAPVAIHASPPPAFTASPYPQLSQPPALPTATLITNTPIPPALPPGPLGTQMSATLTQAAAEATPFPTAQPVIVQTGSPATARVQQDGVSLEIQLAKDTYLAGEGGEARVTVHNDSQNALITVGSDPQGMADITLLDENGRHPKPWPPCSSSTSGLSYSPPIYRLESGQTRTDTVHFQIPLLEQIPTSTFSISASLRFNLLEPGQPASALPPPVSLEGGPIPLKIQTPQPTDRLQVDWRPDHAGWTLKVTDSGGQPLSEPFWGELSASNSHMGLFAPIIGPSNGELSGTWSLDPSSANLQLKTCGWVAAPGHVTASFAQTLPGYPDPTPGQP